MKRGLLILFLAGHLGTGAQITTPIIKARFGIDADLRANYFNGLVQTGNDDWFNLVATDTSGKAVIDTAGAAAMIAGYLADVSPWPKRMASYYRTMSRPTFSIVNNRLWLDALWVRDYHGTDTTVFTSGSDKNGMSPANWTGGIQGIPDKNDILDIFVHIRRAGPNTTDSLWMFGGISLDNTTGNRYFDFEMYQTDIYYDRVSGKWYGYGPNDGHTAWEFDASGNISKPGDIIFSAEYQSSTLSNIEARVWVSRTVWQTVTPTAFNWSGQFDGASAGSPYGYASILPKTAGAFYTGLGSATNTWAGPFRLVLQNNSLVTNYAKDQFMEFSVNLSKLGLDPVSQIGGDICGTPFNRIVIKTRSSSSFTAELKDFVAPTDLFLAPRVNVETQTPAICDTGSIAQIYVTNPVPTSFYQWSTSNGRIVGPTTGTSIIVDTPGTYIVRQYLQVGCSMYASDTIQIQRIIDCAVLQQKNLVVFTGVLQDGVALLEWKVLHNEACLFFDIERSEDGIQFQPLGRVEARPGVLAADYHYTDASGISPGRKYYYRVVCLDRNGRREYSPVLLLWDKETPARRFVFFPNPTNGNLQLDIFSGTDHFLDLRFYDGSGKLVASGHYNVHRGMNRIALESLQQYPPGFYSVQMRIGAEQFSGKIMLVR